MDGDQCRNQPVSQDQKNWKTYSQKEGLTETEIKSLVSVGKKMWAGGIGGSLFEYDAVSDRWKRIEPTDLLKTGGIHSITVTKEKVLSVEIMGKYL